MIFVSNAVANPWTVMIHLHDTFAAEAAVMSSGCFYHVAMFTPAEYHKILKHEDVLTYIFFFNGIVDSLESIAVL